MKVAIVRLDEDLPLPVYGHAGDAGMDLLAREDAWIEPGATYIMPTGIKIAIPEGYVGLVHPRSGLSAKTTLRVANAPGTIDAGYRGEVGVILYNCGDSPVEVNRGDRIAQLVLQKVEVIEWEVTDSLDSTVRGVGGYGSTGGSRSLS